VVGFHHTTRIIVVFRDPVPSSSYCWGQCIWLDGLDDDEQCIIKIQRYEQNFKNIYCSVCIYSYGCAVFVQTRCTQVLIVKEEGGGV